MKNDKLRWLLTLLVFFSVIFPVAGIGGECRASDPFPLYPCIKPNVTFWTKIYSEYSTTQGVIHDSRDLSIIYEVIRLENGDSRRARKTNRKRIDRVRKKYERILRQLAANPSKGSKDARRVATLFGSKATRSHFRGAVRRIRCQVGQKDRFRRGLIRSGAYIDEIKKVFTSYGLPVDLSYLPHVESSFNPRAYSRFGAAGIWQFTHSTGKRFMSVNYTVDERWDPIRASHAAAKLLKSNNLKLGGWPLAITAYNHGVSGMNRARKQKGGYESIFENYRGRRFKFASRNFYSEFLAAREVAKNADSYFGRLKTQRPVKGRETVLQGYASITDISRHFGVSIETLKQFNPALRPPVYRGQKYVPKGYTLRLPAGQSVETASLKLPENIYQSRQKHSSIYLVRKGDTVGRIARIHGIRTDDIIIANNLGSRALILPGQNLRIPAPGKQPVRLASVQKTKKENLVPADAKIAAVEKIALPEKKKPVQKPVKPSIPPKISQPPIDPEAVTGSLIVEEVTHRRGRTVGIIRVGVEETLGHYADWLEIPTKEIRRLNGFPYGRVVRVNEAIKIPLHKIPKDQFEEKRFEYHKEMQEDFFSAYRIEEVKTYNIKNGDNLWSLCLETFQVPFWLINKYNPELDVNKLRPSQKIRIPVVEEIG